ncbi:MAG: glycoside hydrolase family 2 protein [Crocinitomicaceae bacterium]|nr:glycoside hydrolase family 2 protein [Crocinitomicaceae bacterium]
MRPIFYILIFQFFTFNFALCTKSDTLSLNGSWEFKQTDEFRWRKAVVPGVVHLDLMRNHMIEDPYWADNEIKQKWIEDKRWEYKRIFTLSEDQLNRKHAIIEFDGLDTYAQVFINDSLVITANNMYRKWSSWIWEKLKVGENEIRVVFLPIKEGATDYAKRKYDLPAGCETVNEKRSPWVRKAAYHFGWDWGPRFVTCGIWRDVRLVLTPIGVDNINFQTQFISDSVAKIKFSANVHPSSSDLKFTFSCEGEEYVLDYHRSVGYGHLDFQIDNPKLWWCNGYGDPNLYEAEIRLENQNGGVVFKKRVIFGIRTIELINEPDSIGTSFYFKLNGKPVFVKGANYIPQDLFLPSVTNENYQKLLTQVDEANMNMIRVWGGGIYEKDLFYDLCDEKGVMVWQDLMFAGSMYPGDESFIDNIEVEISENVARISAHPCLALWCGNNEMEVAWKNWGWQKQFGWSAKDSTEIWENYLRLFHEKAPEIIKNWDSTLNYTTTSPLSNWGKPENFNHSSMHYWGVWHGKEPIENFRTNVGRFMVEYGFQSYPEMSTINRFCDPKDQKLTSKVMQNRQKSYIGNEEITRQITKYAGKTKSFEEFVKLSQDIQAKALQIAIQSHLGAQPHCMGTLFWQLNDCWPGPSWSVIDYYGNEKKAYGIIKELFLIKN